MKFLITVFLLMASAGSVWSQMDWIELKSLIPHLQYELKYATQNNFTGQRLYPKNTNQAYLRKEPALALAKAATELGKMGLGLKIWDAYRPFSVTVKFWELIRDERYVANPAKGGSGHNKGIAVDLTLVDLESGRELEMPTGFDDFSSAAHHDHVHPDSVRVKNRELLKNAMEKQGFKKLDTEWWHYYWPNSEEYKVMDIPIKKIKLLQPPQLHLH